MAVPRFAGGKSFIILEPKRMSPPEISSCPAIILRVEVLPQPEGPRKQQYVPAGIFKFILSTAMVSPYFFVRIANSKFSGLFNFFAYFLL